MKTLQTVDSIAASEGYFRKAALSLQVMSTERVILRKISSLGNLRAV
jgi:hypothetical protein